MTKSSPIIGALLDTMNLRLERLQETASQTGVGVSETQKNTESLLPLLGLLNAPNETDLTLAENLANTLAGMKVELGKISKAMEEQKTAMADLRERLERLETNWNTLFLDEDSDAS
jgi:hypothetical protein